MLGCTKTNFSRVEEVKENFILIYNSYIDKKMWFELRISYRLKQQGKQKNLKKVLVLWFCHFSDNNIALCCFQGSPPLLRLVI